MTDRELLRHALAILAYRGGKPLREAPESFVHFDTGGGVTPLRILGHIADLNGWALTLCRNETNWVNGPAEDWKSCTERFYSSLDALDAYVASGAPIHAEIPRLMAGPVADALTHVGQLMILRRMAGSPVYGENYFRADIVTGRVGPEQSAPVRAF